ncbi:MAG: hypothetical protein HKN43_07535 [Rhodothermales bacterium]|nr:hypothetical protein [Rhodothermales bacterium]
MDPNLHQKQGINHLNRVLNYANFVVEDGKATVHLTPEDWHVVADTLFHMETPREVLPDAISGFQLTAGNQIIELTTADCVIAIEMI